MKERLLVMNGQRIVQAEIQGKWVTNKVDKAGALKPGMHNLYAAKSANKNEKVDGVILHSDDNKVYLKTNNKITAHSRKDFDKVPSNGSNKSISYNEKGKAIVADFSIQLGKTRSR